MTPEQREALATVLAHYGSDPRVRPLRVLRDQDDEIQELRAALADACELLGLLTDCAAVLRTIDPDDSDEAEKLAELLGAIDRAQAPSRHQGALL